MKKESKIYDWEKEFDNKFVKDFFQANAAHWTQASFSEFINYKGIKDFIRQVIEKERQRMVDEYKAEMKQVENNAYERGKKYLKEHE